MNIVFFKDQQEFREWLEANHKTESEIIVGYYKVTSGKQNMTWSESVDQALCFGWIDGIRRSVDDISYCIRFTPRKKVSNWSAINISKVEELIKKGLMHKSGMDIFDSRDLSKSGTYSFESELKALSDDHLMIFKENETAWHFFENQAPSYKKTMLHWIYSAKLPETRIKRLKILIDACQDGRRV
ncbi:MAG: YdeI/OmpD-associated family protein [Deltaproteobacteria bacterium]